MEIAVNAGDGRSLSTEDWLRLAQAVDALGYHSLWVGENYGLELFGLLGWLAAHTSRVGLGTGIMNIWSRSPALAAQGFATLDRVSNGRAIAGFGASTPAFVANWHGGRWEAPAARMREFLEVFRMVLSGERVDYDGRIFALQGMRLSVPPMQAHVPVFLAAGGKRNRALVAELADGWLTSSGSPDELAQAAGAIRSAAVGARRPPDAVTITPMQIVVAIGTADQRQRARDAVRKDLAWSLSVPRANVAQYDALGFPGLGEQVQAAWRANRSTAYQVVPDALVDHTAIIGDAGWCRERIAQFQHAGAGLFMARLLVGLSVDDLVRSLEVLASATEC